MRVDIRRDGAKQFDNAALLHEMQVIGNYPVGSMTTKPAHEVRGAHDMILPILSRVFSVLEAAGRDAQVDVFLERAEACPSREELVRLAREYVELAE